MVTVKSAYGQRIKVFDTQIPHSIRAVEATAFISLTSSPDSSMLDGSRSTPSSWCRILLETSTALSSMMSCMMVESVSGKSSGLFKSKRLFCVLWYCYIATLTKWLNLCERRTHPMSNCKVIVRFSADSMRFSALHQNDNSRDTIMC